MEDNEFAERWKKKEFGQGACGARPSGPGGARLFVEPVIHGTRGVGVPLEAQQLSSYFSSMLVAQGAIFFERA
jgi:hypothetical protein